MPGAASYSMVLFEDIFMVVNPPEIAPAPQYLIHWMDWEWKLLLKIILENYSSKSSSGIPDPLTGCQIKNC